MEGAIQKAGAGAVGRIGLDFGTTYSIISRVKDGSDGYIEAEACALGEGQNTIQESVVLKDKSGSLVFGPLARDKAGRKNTIMYKGFKMMLAETDEQVLKQRNYDQEYSPSRIIAEYVDDLLKRYLSIYSDENAWIEKLVVGVPEIWFTRSKTIDCRTALKNIIQNFDYVQEVEIVSEPAAACAYFVQNYYKVTGQRYKGKILLIDYGGGTLDIALCDVKGNGTLSDVKIIARAGAGWNTEGTVGRAGMAFIEEIVKIALRDSGKTTDEIIADAKFYKCVYSVEQALMNQMKQIKRVFSMNRLEPDEEIKDKFYDIEYDDDEYEVTYGMLAQAYNSIIRQMLDKKLDEMIRYMEQKGIDYKGMNKTDHFKIALVGGFCNFYLTDRQIRSKFHEGEGDRRFQDIISDRRDCEKAISYGAALIANGVVGFEQVAPYSLGFATKKDQQHPLFAIKKGEDIEFNKVKLFQDSNGDDAIFLGRAIPLIAFNFEDELKYAEVCEPLEEYRDRLRLEEGRYYKLGYSLDRSMNITLHKWKLADRSNPDMIEDKRSVLLDDIYDMIGDLILIGGGKE